MKFLSWKTAGAAVLVAALGFVVGCGRKDLQGDAIGELYEEDLAFTVNDYLRAAQEGRADAVASFLQAGMDVDAVNPFGERALGLATERGHRKVAAVLLGAGAACDLAGPGGRTPLMGAAEAGDAETVARLIELGADPERRDQEGWTALRLAAFHGHAEAVGELLEVTPVETIDSALLLAALGGDVAVLDRLVAGGADVYGRTPEGRTALMLAASQGHRGAARLLLQRGANRFATDPDGVTAAIIADESGEQELADELAKLPQTDLAGAPLPVLEGTEVERAGAVWRLDGAELVSGKLAAKPLEVRAYQEQQLPIALETVEAGQTAAEMRLLYGGHGKVWVRVGEQVPGLPFLIVKVNRVIGERKGDGSANLLQSATVRDLRDGREFVVTPEDPGLSTFTTVDLVDGGGRAFRGRRGDRFELRTARGVLPFRIVELRPREVLVERLDTGEVIALRKDVVDKMGS